VGVYEVIQNLGDSFPRYGVKRFLQNLHLCGGASQVVEVVFRLKNNTGSYLIRYLKERPKPGVNDGSLKLIKSVIA
jgi:hypothetical protein